MSITAITIGGSAVDLDTVDYSVSIYHGRNDVTDSPQPSNAQLSILITGQSSIPYRLSQVVNIKAYGVDRFTGRITDIRLDHSIDAGGVLITRATLICIGNLSYLGSTYTGDAGYIEQNLDARVAAILDATGLTYTVEADPDILLNAYTGRLQPVSSLLGELCEWTGATYYDLPNGSVWFESYTRRGYDYSTVTWAAMTQTWASDTSAWSDQYAPGTVAPTPVVLPAGAVVWEPTWATTSTTILNDITVAYGTADPQDTVNVTDATSITQHGTRAYDLVTGMANVTDATRRAQLVITAQAAERYQLGKVEVLVDNLDSTTRAAVLALKAGARVLVTNLPQPAPITQFMGVVEGWGETYLPTGHRYVLSLSDPRYSYAMAEWDDTPAAATWAGVPIAKTWADIVLPTDLAA